MDGILAQRRLRISGVIVENDMETGECHIGKRPNLTKICESQIICCSFCNTKSASILVCRLNNLLVNSCAKTTGFCLSPTSLLLFEIYLSISSIIVLLNSTPCKLQISIGNAFIGKERLTIE